MRCIIAPTLVAAVVTGGLATAPDARAAACEGGWVVVSSPNLSRTGDNVLKSVAGLHSDDIWAVGQYAADSNPNVLRTLAAHFDGTSWTGVTPANDGVQANSLQSVAVLPNGRAVAVGFHIDDQTFFARSLIETYDGAAWRIAPHPEPGESAHLFAVAALAPTDVWAVGDQQAQIGAVRSLIEHFDGSAWSVVPSPNPGNAGNVLYGVSARATDDAWAVGSQTNVGGPDRALLLHWDGTEWRSVQPPGDGTSNTGLYAVSQGRTGPVAAGEAQDDVAGRTLALIEAGGRPLLGTVATSPRGDDKLYGVAISPAGEWVVGSTTDWQVAGGVPKTLIEYRAGGSGDWSIVPSPNPVPNGENQLGGVAVIDGSAWIVGEHDGPVALQTLIARSCR